MTREQALEHLANAIDHIVALDDERMALATMAVDEGASELMVGMKWGFIGAKLSDARLALYQVREGLRADVRSA